MQNNSNPSPSNFRSTIIISLVAAVVVAGLAVMLANAKSNQSAGPKLPIYGQVNPFTLTNEDGAAVSLADLRGHPWVADIIFTRCAGPCPRMSRQMKELQDALPKDSPVRLVTLTTDPDYDTPKILARYADRFGADTSRWMFLTGTKRQIADVATGSLKLSAGAKPVSQQTSPNDLFIHSTILVAVDKNGQLRGIYQTGGGGVNWPTEKQKVLTAMRQLSNQ